MDVETYEAVIMTRAVEYWRQNKNMDINDVIAVPRPSEFSLASGSFSDRPHILLQVEQVPVRRVIAYLDARSRHILAELGRLQDECNSLRAEASNYRSFMYNDGLPTEIINLIKDGQIREWPLCATE